jgi:hypothetical protein
MLKREQRLVAYFSASFDLAASLASPRGQFFEDRDAYNRANAGVAA